MKMIVRELKWGTSSPSVIVQESEDLRGVKAWVRFFRARTEIVYARRLRFCGFHNNHMTSNTSFGRVLAGYLLLCSEWLSYTDSEIVETYVR